MALRLGDGGHRSHYLSHAKRSLYHLSYIPTDVGFRDSSRSVGALCALGQSSGSIVVDKPDSMQIFVRCGGATVPLIADPEDRFQDLTTAIANRLAVGLSRHDVWYQHGGRRCNGEHTLDAAGIREGSDLQVHLRLRGGGGDGGATGAESRSSYLEMYMEKKPDKVDPAEERLARATTCKLSNERLSPPCVVDELGSLYNKEALISALVSKAMPKALAHISSLKHVTDARLCPIADAADPSGPSFCCPISGQPLNGQYRFCVLLPTGHVISEKALKQVPVAVEEHVGAKWVESLPLNGTKEEVEALWDRLIAKRAATKKGKKEKKRTEIAAAANGVAQKRGSPKQQDGQEAKAPAKRPVQNFMVEEKAAKKVKAVDLAPAHADKKVWASLFTSSQPRSQETYSCRSTSARGWM